MATVIADQPELLALASLAAVPASRMAAAFNDPEHFFEHLSLEELARIRGACERQSLLQTAMLEAMTVYAEAAKRFLAGEDAD